VNLVAGEPAPTRETCPRLSEQPERSLTAVSDESAPVSTCSGARSVERPGVSPGSNALRDHSTAASSTTEVTDFIAAHCPASTTSRPHW
jgi:hypothetical protein